MKPVDAQVLSLLWHDEDAREMRLREIVRDRMAAKPPPVLEDQVIATYFFALRTLKLTEAVSEISYHATSGIKHPPPTGPTTTTTAPPPGSEAAGPVLPPLNQATSITTLTGGDPAVEGGQDVLAEALVVRRRSAAPPPGAGLRPRPSLGVRCRCLVWWDRLLGLVGPASRRSRAARTGGTPVPLHQQFRCHSPPAGREASRW